ncbi:50S ribosomal protein L15 [Phaeodactylibacter luteus]|uniref:Large ribosomal subunit protein uL15 n=1 Tax=Phaeodactylibacter luteus TaxID=1564516 RepID=A0A5C6RJU0_9BACT|nr:50S ribosomal protein L15 [Phaeodactylibacter luteus]TXB61950.1 50S ribosomal protein L15 [Phaeodactylibacter luteus]
MELHSLKPAAGAVKKRKRIARGIGSGHGRTATRGHKGAKSRSGFKNKRNFEGGQMPIQMRLPKVGFKSPNRKEYTAINLERLQSIADKYSLTKVDQEALVKHGILTKTELFKVLGAGELKSKLEVHAHAFSASAKQAIETAGGTATVA